MEISMTDPLLSGGINVIAGAAGPVPIIPGAVVPGFGGGGAPPPPPPPVPLYDLLIAGQVMVGGVPRMRIQGFDRALGVDALLWDEPWGAWVTPRVMIPHNGPAPIYLYRVIDQALVDGRWALSNNALVWVVGDTISAGVGGYTRERLYRNGANLGRVVHSPPDADNAYQMPDLAVTALWGPPAAPASTNTYGTQLTARSIVTNDGFATHVIRRSTTPGAIWVDVTPVGADWPANSKLPYFETMCSSITNRDQIAFMGYRGAGPAGYCLYGSTDEAQTPFWGIDGPFPAPFVPGGAAEPSQMVMTGDILGNFRCVFAVTGLGNDRIWVYDSALGGLVGETYAGPAGTTITDLWWDQVSGEIWASVSPGALGQVRLIRSADNGDTWNDYFAGLSYGGNNGSIYGMGLVGMFK